MKDILPRVGLDFGNRLAVTRPYSNGAEGKFYPFASSLLGPGILAGPRRSGDAHALPCFLCTGTFRGLGSEDMRYLVKARLKPANDLLPAIQNGSLGRGSVAGDEYQDNMKKARLGSDKTVHWVETCFCREPLEEERPYWEKYFELLSVKDAHARKNCRDWNGTEPWACCDCDCTARLEKRIAEKGGNFLKTLGRGAC